VAVAVVGGAAGRKNRLLLTLRQPGYCRLPNAVVKLLLIVSGGVNLMMRPARNAEFAALLALRRAVDLKFLGCRAARGLSGGICLSITGKNLGVWWFEEGMFRFGRMTKGQPILTAKNVAEVVAITRELAFHAAGMLADERGEP
jgi:hypothetical protein